MNKLLLLVIVLLATFLRFWSLGSLPPALTWDEAAWGYNAYSLGIDGKDEFGKFLPYTYLESFGDFKPPVYAYLALPFVKVFGLNEFTTRMPSAFFGVLTVLITFFLVQEIFVTSRMKKTYGMLAAFLLAISPWHINLSRAAFEANVASFFIILGVLLFLFAIRKNMIYLILSGIAFILSLYTFNTARIVSPLLVLLLTVTFYKELLEHRKKVFIAFFLSFLLLLPTIPFLLSPQASLRFKEVNIFSDIKVIYRINNEVERDNNALWSKVIHNRRFAFALEYMRHYFDNLHPNFLFIKGDGNPKFSTQDVGQLYLAELPFLIIGIVLLFRKKEGKWWVIPLWLLIGIIPAGTARETPHALRIETTLPTFQILIAYGFVHCMLYAKKKNAYTANIFSVVVGLALCINVLYYLHGYYVHYAREYSKEWQYGYKEAIAYTTSVERKYQYIYMTDKLGRPYIYVLFYKKYLPDDFRREAEIRRDTFGFVDVTRVGKYYFSNKLNLERKENTLYIDTPSEVPVGAKIIKTFYLVNNTPALVAYEK